MRQRAVLTVLFLVMWLPGTARAQDTGRQTLIGVLRNALTAIDVLPGPAEEPEIRPRPVALKVNRADRIYFQRCAGCHGARREGNTGKPLTTAITRKHGFKYLRDIIHNGTDKGMPSWGASGELSASEVEAMARYLLKPPAPPPIPGSMAEVRSRWKILVPGAKRPSKQLNGLSLDGEVSAKLVKGRQVAVIDKTGTKTVFRVKLRRQAIGARLSASRRYLYTLDCEANIKQFDLWMKPPKPVAEVKVGLEGRSIAVSDAADVEQPQLIAGSNWPPQYVVLDGRTLEPKIVHQFHDFGAVRIGCGEAVN